MRFKHWQASELPHRFTQANHLDSADGGFVSALSSSSWRQDVAASLASMALSSF